MKAPKTPRASADGMIDGNLIPKCPAIVLTSIEEKYHAQGLVFLEFPLSFGTDSILGGVWRTLA